MFFFLISSFQHSRKAIDALKLYADFSHHKKKASRSLSAFSNDFFFSLFRREVMKIKSDETYEDPEAEEES